MASLLLMANTEDGVGEPSTTISGLLPESEPFPRMVMLVLFRVPASPLLFRTLIPDTCPCKTSATLMTGEPLMTSLPTFLTEPTTVPSFLAVP